MKLLVVDDSSVVRKIIKAVADELQMEIEEAQDGVEALEILSSGHEEIDLILLDLNMPVMSGYDVLVKIKRDDKYKRIPVMIVTTEKQASSIVDAIHAGAADYLTKPFTAEELRIKIVNCIGGR